MPFSLFLSQTPGSAQITYNLLIERIFPINSRRISVVPVFALLLSSYNRQPSYKVDGQTGKPSYTPTAQKAALCKRIVLTGAFIGIPQHFAPLAVIHQHPFCDLASAAIASYADVIIIQGANRDTGRRNGVIAHGSITDY